MISAGSQELTQKWVDVLHNESEDYIIPESDVNIMCPYDCVSLSGYTVTGYSAESISNVSALASNPATINRNKKIATFEWNYWVLDGSFEVLDDNETVSGFVSTAISNGNCEFGVTPFVFFETSTAFALKKNQTLKFNPSANEIPASITIQSQNNSGTLNSIDFNIEEILEEDNLTEREYVNLFSDSIDTSSTNTRAVIVFTKTLMPYRRVRLTEYNNGYKFFKNKYDLQTYVHTRTVSLNMEELPQNDLEISFADLEGIYDKRNTSAPFHINFTQNHKFYVFNGYNFDDIGWQYVMVDTVAYDTLEFDRDNLSTVIKGKSTLLNYNQKYPTNKLWKKSIDTRPSAPYWWEHFWGFIGTIRAIANMPLIHHDSLTTPFLETAYNQWQIYLYISLGIDNDFAKTPAIELLQQIVGVLNNCLVRYPNEELYMRYMVNRPLNIVDSIDGTFMTSYPTSTKDEGYKTIYVDTPPVFPEQKPDTDTSNGVEQSPTYYYHTRLGFTVDSSNSVSEETELKPNIIALAYKYATNGWYWQNGQSATKLFGDYATQYNKIHKATRYEVGDTFINPLLQVADLITINPSEDIKIYRGYIEKIEINYDGSFKGAVTICSIDD